MKSLLPGRLAYRLILSLTFIIVIAEGISGWINVRAEEQLLLNSMITGADQLSRAVTSATWHSMLADHRDAAYEVMQTIALKQGIDRIRIFNKEGRIMFSTTEEHDPQVDKKAEACYLCHATDQPLVKVDVPSRSRIYQGVDGTRKLAMVTPIYNEPSCSDASCHAHPRPISVLGVLDVSLDLSRVDSEIAEVEERAIISTVLHVFLVGLVIVLFTRHFVDAPIRKLIAATRNVSEMVLDKPVGVSATGELAELARSFDLMRTRLQQALNDLNEFAQGLESRINDRTEQLEKANKKLLQSDRLASLGQLSASVAHEINNPIAGVLNLTMLMQRILTNEGIPPHRIDEFRGYLIKAAGETSRVGRIVTDLLAFSRRSKPQRTNSNLNAVLNATLSIIDHRLKLMNVAIRLQLEEHPPPILCDVSQMQQVLINLIMNAAESMQLKEERILTLRTCVDLDERRLILEVTDTGDGIPPEIVSKIFDPFYTTKEEGKGVGLGLAVVYGIIEAHKGEIQVKSSLGQGTTFTVSLPLSEALEPTSAGVRKGTL